MRDIIHGLGASGVDNYIDEMEKNFMKVMEWWRQEGNVWAIMVLVNDHDGRKVFWEASLVEIHV